MIPSSPAPPSPDRRTAFLSAFVPSLTQAQTGQRLVALRILVALGWVLVAGQAASIMIVFFRSGAHMNLGFGLGVLALGFGFNLFMARAWRRRSADRAWVSVLEAGRILALHMGQTTGFLMVTGGVLNPFVILLLAPVSVSATALTRRLTARLVILAVVLISVLTVAYLDLPWRNSAGGVEALILPLDYRAATWTALVVSVVFFTLFISWQAELARRTTRSLDAARLALEREQTLASVGALAAAAAHELGTPLATIAVTARELADVLSEEGGDETLIADANLLVEETQRCREILTTLSKPDTNAVTGHEAFISLSLEDILRQGAQAHNKAGHRFEIETEGQGSQPHLTRQPELVHGLGNILQNAFQFATAEVRAVISWDATALRLTVIDDGPGYPPSLLDKLGQPYVQGAQSSRPSMGLGLFIATSLLRHGGAEVAFANGESGAEVTVSWVQPISGS